MNNEILEYADKYSHDIWEKLMLKFKTTESYTIGCNDVSDIVLNAIIDACNWQKEQMMKNSTDAYIHRNRYTKTNVLHLDVTCDAVQGFKDNDKLKAIFIKED